MLNLMDEICNHLRAEGGSARDQRGSTTIRWSAPATCSRETVCSVASALKTSDAPKWKRFGGKDLAVLVFPAPPCVVVRAAYFTRAVFEALHDNLGVEKLRQLPLPSLGSLFVRSMAWPEEDFEKNAKYFCVRPMAEYLRQDLPTPPAKSYGPTDGKSWLLFSGPLRRILSNRLNSYTSQNSHLFNTLLQGVKRACHEISSSLVYSTLMKHSETLAKHKPVAKDLFEWGAETKKSDIPADDGLNKYIKRVVHALYKQPLGEPKLYEPSTSACLTNSRAKGGAYSIIDMLDNLMQVKGGDNSGTDVFMDEDGGIPEKEPPRPSSCTDSQERTSGDIYNDMLGNMGWKASVFKGMVETRPGKVVEIREKEPPEFQDVLSFCTKRFHLNPLRECLDAMEIGFMDFDPEHHPTLVPDLMEVREGGKSTNGWGGPELLPSDVNVSAVLEPLKVRLVSAGEPIKYWLSTAMQKYMWRGLQNSEVFRLTGRPLMQSDLWDLWDGDSAGSWVSGDYSAATDSIRLGWTVRVFEEILGVAKVDNTYAAMLRRVLYGQVMNYKFKGVDPDLKPWSMTWSSIQASGQLMGSTLSFPVLCILNLAAYWQALEKTLGERVSHRDLKVLINGDDILFRCPGPNSELYQNWLRSTAEVGFSLSPGKNYVHRRYLTVNSQAYDFNPETKVLKPIGFFNVGLLVGQSKVSHRRTAQLTPLQGKYEEVIRGAWSKLRAHHRFVHYNRSTIEDLTYGGRFSLFIDPLLGGLGFPLHPEVATEVNFTRFQKGFARYCLRQVKQPKIGHLSNLPKCYLGVVAPRASYASQRPDCSWATVRLQPRTDVLEEGHEPLPPMCVTTPILSRVIDPPKEMIPDGKGSVKEVLKELPPTLRFPKLSTLQDFRVQRNLGMLNKSIKAQVLIDLSRTHWWVITRRT